MLEAADDPGPDLLGQKLAESEAKRKRSLDDLLRQEAKPRDWPV